MTTHNYLFCIFYTQNKQKHQTMRGGIDKSLEQHIEKTKQATETYTGNIYGYHGRINSRIKYRFIRLTYTVQCQDRGY